MRLDFNIELIHHYHSASQIARILTETWVTDNMFCPQCGHLHIEHFKNNRPVADFFCPICRNEYELKSKNGNLGNKVADGAYETMIERITGNENPDFFFMNYSKASFKVVDNIRPKIHQQLQVLRDRGFIEFTERGKYKKIS